MKAPARAWVRLPSGRRLDLIAPTPFDWTDEDLAIGLSRTFRLSERVRLQAIAESFNVLNHRNDLIPNGTFGSGAYPTSPGPGFAQRTAVGDPRTAQIALRLSF